MEPREHPGLSRSAFRARLAEVLEPSLLEHVDAVFGQHPEIAEAAVFKALDLKQPVPTFDDKIQAQIMESPEHLRQVVDHRVGELLRGGQSEYDVVVRWVELILLVAERLQNATWGHAAPRSLQSGELSKTVSALATAFRSPVAVTPSPSTPPAQPLRSVPASSARAAPTEARPPTDRPPASEPKGPEPRPRHPALTPLVQNPAYGCGWDDASLNATGRCALWERVSDPHQATGAQHYVLVGEAERRGLTVARVFDITASGYHGQQEHQLTELVGGLRRGEYGVVICWAIDRLTRQGISETLQAVHRITESGGTLISVQEPWVETSGEVRDLLLSIVGWVAKFESKRRSERIKAGIARRRAAGLGVGRKPGAKDRKPRKVSGHYLQRGR